MDVADGLEALGECVEAELWESVEVLAAMLAARLETMANTHGSLLSVLYDRADALVELRRDREAVVAYDTLLERLDQSRTRVKLRNRRATRRDICAKLAKCHLRLGDHAAGIAVIEAVPEADRTLAMRMALGRALTAVHREQAASACFSAVIESQPAAIAAAIELARGGRAAQATEALARTPEDDRTTVWETTSALVEAHGHAAASASSAAAAAFEDLLGCYPDVPDLVLPLARTSAQLSNQGLEAALRIYEAYVARNPHRVGGLDHYAHLLAEDGQTATLVTLAQNMLSSSKTAAEPWVAAALAAWSQTRYDAALGFVDKALAIDRRHFMAHLARGTILRATAQLSQAVTSYREALTIRRDIAATEGLVRACIAIAAGNTGFSGRSREQQLISECTAYAEDAKKRMPQSSKAWAMWGLALSQRDQTRKLARAALERALKIDPACATSVLGLVYLNTAEQKHEDSIALLRLHLTSRKADVMHETLAGILVETKDYVEALTHYNKAISLNPMLDGPRAGIERLEKLLRGIDPDASDMSARSDDSVESIEYQSP